MKANFFEVGALNMQAIFVKKVNKSNFNSLFHFHEVCELNYIVEGTGKCIVGDCIRNYSAGDLVLLGPNLPHIWYGDPSECDSGGSQTGKAIVVYFPANYLKILGLEEPFIQKVDSLIEKSKAGVHFPLKTRQKVTALLNEIVNATGLTKIILFLEIMNVLINTKRYEQLSSLAFRFSLNEKDTERMNNVYRYTLENFRDPIDLSTIAKIANMTPPAFCGFFKKRTGKSFTGFLNELRIGHACKLLGDLDLTIADICYNSGYRNFTHFNDFFKKITAKTPSEYRKELMSIEQTAQALT
ncbi:AraC family transcriptional regulator [Chitinophaga polysaccharea]|uniref:AraC family transcriptional regulator n=1 Tax=Chitinophaga TaxID=79328 RepID=UPI00145587E2|nr:MULTISPECIES: AraC family transcriptional regulator [Chitinophaga]NLR60659.1 AraC family transcriptional regulator [Chitinophaga polysaccharea]NLU90644.1 AraC family transcriptional regulator [Chitinophaga sp. Ak27]